MKNNNKDILFYQEYQTLMKNTNQKKGDGANFF